MTVQINHKTQGILDTVSFPYQNPSLESLSLLFQTNKSIHEFYESLQVKLSRLRSTVKAAMQRALVQPDMALVKELV